MVNVDDGDERGTATMQKSTELLPNRKNPSSQSAPGHTCRGNANAKRYTPPRCSLHHYLQQPGRGSNPRVQRPMMDQGDAVHIRMEYYAAIKRKEAMPFAGAWLDPGMILLTEVSQRKANISLICRL